MPSKGTTVSGTLIVVVLFQEGYVICADRRGGYDEGERQVELRDDLFKLFQLGPSCIAAVAGTGIMLNYDSAETSFDIPKILLEFASKKSFVPSEDMWSELISLLETSFEVYLANQNFEAWPDTPEAHKNLFEIPFFVKNLDKLEIFRVSMKYSKQQPPKVDPQFAHLQISGLFCGFGANYIVNILPLDGYEEVNDLRENPIVKPFLSKDRQQKQVTLKEAIALGQHLIKISSEREASKAVSPESDYVILRKIGGVKWPSDTRRPRQ